MYDIIIGIDTDENFVCMFSMVMNFGIISTATVLLCLCLLVNVAFLKNLENSKGNVT